MEQFGAGSVLPNGDNGTTGIATRGSATQPLFFIPHDVTPNFFSRAIPFDSSKTGSWNLTFTNGTDTATKTTPNIVGAQIVPFVNSVTISGSGATPTFSWTVPSTFTPDAVLIQIRDATDFIGKPGGVGGGGVANVIYKQFLPAGTTSFTVPPNLPPPETMRDGPYYSLEIDLLDTRDNLADQNLANVLSRSQSFFDFTLLKAGDPPAVYLPNLVLVPGAKSYYQFHISNFVAGQTVFIDPLVATGFTYMIGAGDPNFASVDLPTGIGDNLFQLFLWNGTDFIDSGNVLTGGIEYSFAGSGVDRFQIRGIETSAGLDPFDATAFITGLTFAGSGGFNGTMTPLTQDVPEPTILSLIALGFAGLRWSRRRPK
jgi:hypothetical protein